MLPAALRIAEKYYSLSVRARLQQGCHLLEHAAEML